MDLLHTISIWLLPVLFLPLLGSQLGLDLGFLSRLVSISTDAVIGVILRVTGNI
jgi:hypothetical protein